MVQWLGDRILRNGPGLKRHQEIAGGNGSASEGDFRHDAFGVDVGHLDPPYIFVRFTHLAEGRSLTRVSRCVENFPGGANHRVLRAHGDVFPAVIGKINGLAGYELADYRVGIVILSANHGEVIGKGRAGDEACAIRLRTGSGGNRRQRGGVSFLGERDNRRGCEKHYCKSEEYSTHWFPPKLTVTGAGGSSPHEAADGQTPTSTQV